VLKYFITILVPMRMTMLTRHNFRFIILHTLHSVNTGPCNAEKSAQLEIFAYTGH